MDKHDVTPEQEARRKADEIMDALEADGVSYCCRADRNDIRHAIATALAEARREWQPIETAPKDDTWVLLYCPGEDEPVTMGTYFRDDERDPMGRFKAGEWCFMEFDGLPSSAHPTHWMPLPEPPK